MTFKRRFFFFFFATVFSTITSSSTPIRLGFLFLDFLVKADFLPIFVGPLSDLLDTFCFFRKGDSERPRLPLRFATGDGENRSTMTEGDLETERRRDRLRRNFFFFLLLFLREIGEDRRRDAERDLDRDL